MPGSLNKVMLIGNLGSDPEVKTIGEGTKVANFSIATDESYKDKSGQKVAKTEWHRIVVWRKLADICEKWLKKGQTVYIEGKITTRSWDDDNGVKKYVTEIVAHNMTMLGGKKEGGSTTPAAGGQQAPPAEDDLPF